MKKVIKRGVAITVAIAAVVDSYLLGRLAGKFVESTFKND